jgi:hypothetical protein
LSVKFNSGSDNLLFVPTEIYNDKCEYDGFIDMNG